MNDSLANLRPMRLLVGPAEATQQLAQQMERGKDIRSRRVRSRQELDSVRAEKNAWVQSLTQTFRSLFSYATPAEQHVQWTPPILPEYAGLELFVEQFYEEMDQRLARLKEVGKLVAAMPDPTLQSPPTDDAQTGAGPAAAAVTEIAAAPAQPALARPRPRPAMNQPAQPAYAETPTLLLLDLPGIRPEENVLIGQFLEKLGLPVRCIGADEPLAIDPAGAWQLQLARMLKASGIPVDLNRLL